MENNNKRDIIGQLWKMSFYRQIEEFRSALKKCKTKLQADQSSPLAQQVKNHMTLVQQEFDHFLSYGIQFFQRLMTELEKKANNLSNTHSLVNDHYMHNVHRSLLCLGDLSRYKELYSEKEQKDFTESVRFYERAALIVPSSGMPQNQLAMLATYNEAESTALYHYCRSIMADNAFTGGFENIARLFAVNKSSYEQLHQQVQRPNFSDLRSRKPDNTKFKYFLTSFVRLHGILFAWSIRMHLEYLKATGGGNTTVEEKAVSSSQKSASHESSSLLSHLNDIMSSSVLKGVTDEIQIDQIHGMIMSLLEELDVQLHSQKLTDLHLLRLVAISIFSVHFAENPEFSCLNTTNEGAKDKNTGSGGDLSVFIHSCSMASSGDGQAPDSTGTSGSGSLTYRSKIQSLALVAIFGLVNRVTQRLTSAESHEKNRKVYNDKILAMLSIFCEWLGQHPTYLSVVSEIEVQGSITSAPRGEDVALPSFFADLSASSMLSSMVFTSVEDTPLGRWRKKFFSGKDLVLMETRARSSLKGVLGLLKESVSTEGNARVGSSGYNQSKDPSTCLLLREHAELRGYLPLGDKFESFFSDFDPLRKTVQWLSEGAARTERQKSIVKFVDEFLLTPSNTGGSLAGHNTVSISSSGRRLVDVDMNSSTQSKNNSKQKDGNARASKGSEVASDRRSKQNYDDAKMKKDKKEKKPNKREKKGDSNSDKAHGGTNEKPIETNASNDDQVLVEDFPPIPGSQPPKVPHDQTFWSYQVDGSDSKVEDDEEIGSQDGDGVEETESESEEEEKGDNSFIHQPTPTKSRFAQEEIEDEEGDVDDIFDDLDDVVFRPAFQRVPEQSLSPFAGTTLGGGSALLNISLQSNNDSFLGSGVPSPQKSPLLDNHTIMSNDIFSSLGVQRSLSGNRLDELNAISQHNSSIWEKLGLGNNMTNVSRYSDEILICFEMRIISFRALPWVGPLLWDLVWARMTGDCKNHLHLMVVLRSTHGIGDKPH